jgi:hypothetical protein
MNAFKASARNDFARRTSYYNILFIARNSKQTLYSITYFLGLINTIPTSLSLILEKLLTYIFQEGIIRCYSTGASSSTKEVVVKGEDSNIYMGPFK